MSMDAEHFEHGADIGVRGRGRTAGEAFEGAARALFLLLAEDLAGIGAEAEQPVACEGGTLEELLVVFLNELIFFAESRSLVFGSFEVKIEKASEFYRLTGRARGEPFSPDRHTFTVQPKGATFTELEVSQRDGEWVAQCVVDV